MRAALRWIAIASILLAGWAAPPPRAQAASLDTVADRVIGQSDFTQGIANSNGLDATGLSDPAGAALNKRGNL